MSEGDLQRRILLACSRGDARLFRQNVGVGWAGEVISRKGPLLVLKNPRPLHAGLCEGSSDLIGWRTVTITPEMVGTKVAVFVAIEVKSERGRQTEAQRIFLSLVNNHGGIAGIARSPDEAAEILQSADNGRSGALDAPAK